MTRACPPIIWADQGSEFISKGTDLWAYGKGMALDFSRPENPMENAFSGRFRAECINSHWVMSLEDAAEKLETWCRDRNEERLHGPIRNKLQANLVKSAHDTSP